MSAHRPAALAAALLLAAACRPGKPPAPDVVARIGDTEVHYSELEGYLARTAGDGESVLASNVLSQIFDQFLDEELLVRLAVDRGLVKAESLTGKGAGARRRAIDELLQADLKEPGDQSEREIAAYYAAHREELTRPERVRLRQILTEDRASAERALREIAAGADFGRVAERLSRDPAAKSGGYQGELSRQDLPPAFADIIFSLQPGQVSRLVPADYGFHIFQVVSRSPAEVVPLEAARAEISAKLREQRADQLLAALVRDARRRYNVELYERNLPFEYQGSYSHAPKTP
jgi:O6-methylguanine-DNA--protein-cysteine methyltransferase